MHQFLLQAVGDDHDQFFRSLHGRTLNNLNLHYLLPADHDEVQRSDIHHRLLQFVFSGRNYVGPVKQALQFGEQRRGSFAFFCVLPNPLTTSLRTPAHTLTTSAAPHRAIDIADEFPRAEVIAIDLAPIQPRNVPPNCTQVSLFSSLHLALISSSSFELCDLDQWNIPYPDAHFDFIHARSIHVGVRFLPSPLFASPSLTLAFFHTQIHNYPRFLHEIARLLRPGGLVLLVEPTLDPCPPPPSTPPMPGWAEFWKTYRACLSRQLIDVTVPERLGELLAATSAFENIVVRDGNIPVGFWPQGSPRFFSLLFLSRP
ncbi:hypothetical protein CVT26_003178, partial [Gymnopilus dilepis]